MSSVRMCDVCGAIFSEAEEGWQTGRIATVGEDKVEKIVTQDRCPSCAVGVKGKPKMRPRIETAVDSTPAPLPAGEPS